MDNMRVQMDSRVGEIAGDLRAQPEHANGDPDSFVFKVDSKLLPPAVRARPLSRTSTELPALLVVCSSLELRTITTSEEVS